MIEMKPLPSFTIFICKAGMIGLEMFGFKIPVADVSKALDTISLSASLGIHRALTLMLQPDPLKRYIFF